MNNFGAVVIFLLSLAMIKTPLFQAKTFEAAIFCCFFLSLCMFLSLKDKDKKYTIVISGIFSASPNIIPVIKSVAYAIIAIVFGSAEHIKAIISIDFIYIMQAVLTFIIGTFFSFIFYKLYNKRKNNISESDCKNENLVIKNGTGTFTKKYSLCFSFTIILTVVSAFCILISFIAFDYYKSKERLIHQHNENLISEIVSSYTSGSFNYNHNYSTNETFNIYENGGRYYISNPQKELQELRSQAYKDERYLKEKKDDNIYENIYYIIYIARITSYYILLACLTIISVRKVKNFKIEKSNFLQRFSTIIIFPSLIVSFVLPLVAMISYLNDYSSDFIIIDIRNVIRYMLPRTFIFLSLASLSIGISLLYNSIIKTRIIKIVTPIFNFFHWIKTG